MAETTRRGFIKAGLAASSAAALVGAQESGRVEAMAGEGEGEGTRASRRPNILWIQTDEQRPDSLGCYGLDWVRSPNLDRLASTGVTFTECHAPSPVCVPSRTSMLFCQPPMQTGIFENSPAFKDGFVDQDKKTWVNLFAEARYRTASYGKWHTPNHPTWQENQLFHLFGHVTGYYEMTPPYDEADYDVVKRPGNGSIFLAGRYPHHDWGVTPSSHVTDWGIDWLRRNGQGEEPWLLRISHTWPHTPVLVPEPWDKLFGPDDVPCNALNRTAYEARSGFDRWFVDRQQGFDLTMDQWRQSARDYYALCAYVDHEVGRLVHALEELGLMENTIIAFNADHGRSLGEVGLTEKGTYDREVWRVPFIMSGPGLPQGEVRDDLADLMDFGPTLCAMAGIDLADGMQGRDLFHSDEPDAVFGVIDIGPYRRAGIRTKRHRFDCTVSYKGERTTRDAADPNLFDIESDPEELNNLIHDPANRALADELYGRIVAWYEQNAG